MRFLHFEKINIPHQVTASGEKGKGDLLSPFRKYIQNLLFRGKVPNTVNLNILWIRGSSELHVKGGTYV